MGQTQHRATEVAETLSRFIKSDLAEDLSLAMIQRKFPGLSTEVLLRVFAICHLHEVGSETLNQGSC